MACEVMAKRGVKDVINDDLFLYAGRQFDTLLFLMNGIGITGTLLALENFLAHARTLLNPGGQLIFDSSDIAYLYEGGIQHPHEKYYGEITYRYEYNGQEGAWFNWLYIDQSTLRGIALRCGWIMTVLFEDDQDQYLVSLR
ncbi:MAG: hypothetical protein EOP49_43590 [Sphingobacteriales bacterium]|nr:MAG: hypothetical protein EOP49_43590 [Sphingobacteriales bacterium]